MAPPPDGKPKAGPRGAGIAFGNPPSGGGVAVELRFDTAFVEEAVFLELSRLTRAGSHQVASSFHREREAVYELPDAQQRDAAFQRLARRAFQALGLTELFTERLSEVPHVSAHVELIVVRRVWNRKDEQVELYGGPSTRAPARLASPNEAAGGIAPRPASRQRRGGQDSAPRALPVGLHRPADRRLALEVSTTLFIGLQAIRCLDRGKLTAFLRHELAHVADMLDPAFAYDPHAAFGGECEPENELIRERFRVLWDLWVHARMRRRQWQTILDDDAHQRDVMRAFASLSPLGQEELFTAVNQQDRWTQGELLALARLPAEASAQAGHAHSEAAA